MFSLGYLFGIFGTNNQQMRLLQLLKQFDRRASLGFTVEGCPSLTSPTLGYKKEFQRELLFRQDDVSVFKIEPMPTVKDNVLMQKFNWFVASDNPMYDEKKLHFILKATSSDQIIENDIRKNMRSKVILNNTPVDVLAWMTSHSTITLLLSSTVEEYATFGSALLRKNLGSFFHLDVQHMYSIDHGISSKALKPPNILIYTGDNEKSSDKFKKAKKLLGQCLDQDKYVIYQLKPNHILTYPWRENTRLLVVATDQEIEKPIKDTIDSFVDRGGRLVSFCTQYTLGAKIKSSSLNKVVRDINLSGHFESSFKSLGVHCVDAAFEVEKNDRVNILALTSTTSQAVIVSVLHGSGLAILSLADLLADKLELYNEYDCRRKRLLKNLLNYLGLTCKDLKKSVLTEAYLLGNSKDKRNFLESVKELLVNSCFEGNSINLLFSNYDSVEERSPSETWLPIIASSAADQVSFCFSSYKRFLETKDLGHLVIYSDVVTSTQTILNGSLKLIQKLPQGCGLVVLGQQQILGKGRGANDWLSPDGCLSFSFPIQVDLDSHLGSRLPFIQHIAALAVVEGVQSMKSYKDINLRIKWPNDIYFGRDTKIGGILVNSSFQGKMLYAVIGIGVNLDNSEPTTCINDIVDRENHLYKRNLSHLSREQLLAKILNAMEGFLEDFQLNGPENFLNKYHQRWLHSDAQVILQNANGQEVTIKGLDNMGFLSVVTSSNEVISVQPDGNSFDMMRNLIAMKTHQ